MRDHFRKLRERPIALLWLVASMLPLWGVLFLLPRTSFDFAFVEDLSLVESFLAALGLAVVMLVGLAVYAVCTVWLQERFRLALEGEPEDVEDSALPDG